MQPNVRWFPSMFCLRSPPSFADSAPLRSTAAAAAAAAAGSPVLLLLVPPPLTRARGVSPVNTPATPRRASARRHALRTRSSPRVAVATVPFAIALLYPAIDLPVPPASGYCLFPSSSHSLAFPLYVTARPCPRYRLCYHPHTRITRPLTSRAWLLSDMCLRHHAAHAHLS